MINDPSASAATSPFHAGEQQMQTGTGRRAAIEAFGRRAIRPHMPEQHQTFFGQQPFLVLGSVDRQRRPWASLIAGQAGFIRVPDASTLIIKAALPASSPLGDALFAGASLGVLGIDLGTRRRNRVNGRITTIDDTGLTMAVDQSFGNCPQYIQRRTVVFDPASAGQSAPQQPARLTTLDAQACAMIAAADTCFVASYISTDKTGDAVDVSHRGGRPGFIKISGNTLTIPDFAGNRYFNTLGNFVLNPKAGLLFIDFTTGDLLMLTGTVALLESDHPEVQGFQGAERAWRFVFEAGIRQPQGVPFRAEFIDYSPTLSKTGAWPAPEPAGASATEPSGVPRQPG